MFWQNNDVLRRIKDVLPLANDVPGGNKDVLAQIKDVPGENNDVLRGNKDVFGSKMAISRLIFYFNDTVESYDWEQVKRAKSWNLESGEQGAE